ncbi:hypothetical protein ACH5RR_032431, partial [Cinchona calisaya]
AMIAFWERLKEENESAIVELKECLEEATKKRSNVEVQHDTKLEKMKKESERVTEDLRLKQGELDTTRSENEKLKADLS